MKANSILDRVQIASPCSARWSDMKGNDRVRFCDLCQLHVYNLSALSAAQAVALVEQSDGRLCARFYRRRDGTMLTANCPVGAEQQRRGRLVRFASAAALGLTSLFGSLMLARVAEGSQTESVGPLNHLVDWVQIQLGLKARPTVNLAPRMIMGKIVRDPLSQPLHSPVPGSAQTTASQPDA